LGSNLTEFKTTFVSDPVYTQTAMTSWTFLMVQPLKTKLKDYKGMFVFCSDSSTNPENLAKYGLGALHSILKGCLNI